MLHGAFVISLCIPAERILISKPPRAWYNKVITTQCNQLNPFPSRHKHQGRWVDFLNNYAAAHFESPTIKNASIFFGASINDLRLIYGFFVRVPLFPPKVLLPLQSQNVKWTMGYYKLQALIFWRNLKDDGTDAKISLSTSWRIDRFQDLFLEFLAKLKTSTVPL